MGVFVFGQNTDPATLLSALRSHVLSSGSAALVLPWTSLQDVTDVLLLLSDDITFAAPGHSMVVTPLVYNQQRHMYPVRQQRHQRPGCAPEVVRIASTDDAIFQTKVSTQEATDFVLVVSTCATGKLESAALTVPSTLPLNTGQQVQDSSPDSDTSIAQLSACNVALTHLGSFEALLQDGRSAAIDRLLDGVVCKGEATLVLQCRYDAGSIREAFQVLSDTGSLLRNINRHDHTTPAREPNNRHINSDSCISSDSSTSSPDKVACHPRLADIAELLRCSRGGEGCMQHCNLVLQPEVLLRRSTDGRRRGALFFSVHIVRSVS